MLPEDHSTDELLGSNIEQYRIEEKIGAGGMGVVYRAVHTEIGQLAAVKVLSTRFAQNPRGRYRFSKRRGRSARLTIRGW
jgi:serine/threonine protein kinase